MAMQRTYVTAATLVALVSALAYSCGNVVEESPGGGDAGVGPDGETNGGGNGGESPELSPEHSSITGDDGVTADGEDVAEVTIELFDDDENPVSGVTPAFGASGEGNDYEPCSATDDDGVSTCGMTSTEAGEKTLEVTEPVQVTGDTIEFLPPCDETGTPFGGGDGSASDPHRLCSPDHLNAVGDGTDELGSAFVVLSDIDMSGVDDFNMIGEVEEFSIGEYDPFTGEFDGRGFAISDLTIEYPDEGDVGLFRRVEGADIRRVNLENVDVLGENRVGALVGDHQGTIEDSHVTGQVAGAGFNIGGLVGRHAGGEIVDSSAAADVQVDEFGTSGGLAGTVFEGAISGSHATGSVSTSSPAGGLVGSLNGGASVEDSYATGEVQGGPSSGGLIGFVSSESTIADSYAEGDVFGNEEVGGLAGITQEDALIIDSYATGAAQGTGESVGGLVGLNEGSISRCHASGSADGEDLNVGGLVGHNEGEITESHATGDAFGELRRVGGLVGANDGTISASFATGDASSESRNIGGLVGVNRGPLPDSYAMGDATGLDSDLESHSVGGLVGQNIGGSIERAYSTGHPEGDRRVGGLVGWQFDEDDAAVNSYWDRQAGDFETGVGEGNDNGVTGRDTAEFNDEGNFTGWDFTNVWTIEEAPDGVDRPIVRWQD